MSTDSNFLSPLFKLFGQLLMWLYEVGGSYVLALILFTLVIKLVMFPLSIKSKKSMMQTQALQGQMQKLQAQYGKDKNRYNEEVSKLYQKEGVNPMGGCLWSLLPLPILFGVYAVVRRPMFFMYGLSVEQIEAVNGVIETMGIELTGNVAYAEMQVANLLNTNASFLEAVKTALGEAAVKLDTLVNFSFIGLNLADTPKLKFWEGGITWNSVGLVLIPVVVAIFSIFSSKVTQRTNSYSRNQQSNEQADRMNKQMTIMMPIMYVWFGFIMPAAMCIYMMANALLTTVSEIIASRMLRKKYLEMQAQREAQEALEKEEEKRRKAERIAQRQREEAEAKERRKKAAAIAAAGGSTVSEKKKEHKDSSNNSGAVGIRKYAKGRNYDPNRYGSVTLYKDPSVVDEDAIEAALAKKKNRKKKDEE